MAAVLQPTSRAEGSIDALIFNRFFSNQRGGVFVEVGAAGPEYLSNSAFFREMGWRILAIEPNPAFAQKYRERGLEVLPYACGDEDRDEVDFTLVHSHGIEYAGGALTYESMSALTVDPRMSAMRPELVTSTIRVDQRRLDTILANRAPDVSRIDILSVDVEGSEMSVIRGLSFARYRPKVCIVENIFSDASQKREMAQRGYVLWTTSGPNEIHVRSDLLSAGERAARRAMNLARSALHAVRRSRHETTQPS